MQTILVKTSDGQLFACRDTGEPDLSHVWNGIAVKRVAAGQYAPKGTARMQLVRKAASTILGTYPGSV